MTDVSRDPREHWLKPRFSKNEVANSGFIISRYSPPLSFRIDCTKVNRVEYAFPGNGYSAVNDQFALGDSLIVAPQIEKGAESREVCLPAGRWLADDGEVFTGPARIIVKTPLSRLPHFVKAQ